MADALTAPESDGDYIFTGGYSNRDYETFFSAVSPLTAKVIAVASKLNGLGETPTNTDVRFDIPWDEFEHLIAGCALVVLPLREGGEACGQNVLFRAVSHGRPVVATRHDSLVEYLGEDYPGFVAAHDPAAMRAAIDRALRDDNFRRRLVERVKVAARWLDEQEQIEGEILRILKAPRADLAPLV
jgi:glycosyltransferase involved in cell wall biosynthesis